MKTLLRIIDTVSEYSGRAVSWVCVSLVLVLAYEVTARYVFDAPTIWAHQFSTMLGASIAALGWSYTHRHHGHIRIDLIYGLLPTRGKAGIDIFFALFFFFPLFVGITIIAANWMESAWRMGEVFTESYWRPPAGPIRTIMFLGLSFLVLQGVAEFIRDIYTVLRKQL